MPFLHSFYWLSYISNFLPINLIKNFVAADMVLDISQCYKGKKEKKSGPVKFESQIILF